MSAGKSKPIPKALLRGGYMDFTVENAGTALSCHEYEGLWRLNGGQTIVCVHGACVDSSFFDGIARELSRWFRVVTYDRRGSGESAEAADGRYDAATQAADLTAVIGHVGAPVTILAHSAGTLVTMELLRGAADLIDTAILHEPAVKAEGVGLGVDPKLVEQIEAGKTTHALTGFLGHMDGVDPRAPRSTEMEARHLLRNGRNFMAHEYLDLMSYAPAWQRLAAFGKVVTVGLGELSLETPRSEACHAAAERLGCTVTAFPGSHNGLRDHPRESAWLVRGVLGC